MIKSVLQSIPSYIMSIYVLHKAVVNDIEKMLNSFWWGGGGGTGSIKWLAWDMLAFPKTTGGMGFRNYGEFNLAMVAKQGWNFLTNPTSLVSQIFKARYFPRTSFLDAKLGFNPSFAWRSIWMSRQVLLCGCRWRIGDGSQIRVMQDPWLRCKQGGWLVSPQNQGVYDLFLAYLMIEGSKEWDVEKVFDLLSAEGANSVLKTPLFPSVQDDQVTWKEEWNGVYFVRTGYHIVARYVVPTSQYQVQGDWNSMWKVRSPPKARNLL